MIGLRVLQHEEGRTFLLHARAGRVAQAEHKHYVQTVREESTILGLR